jgi:hypothetical protein
MTTDTTEIQKIIRNYCKQLYTNNFDSLKENDRFVDIHLVNTESLRERNSKQTMSNETESAIKVSHQSKVPNQMASLPKSTKYLKKN